MAQQVRALAALVQDPGLDHMATQPSVIVVLGELLPSGPPQVPDMCVVHSHTFRQNASKLKPL